MSTLKKHPLVDTTQPNLLEDTFDYSLGRELYDAAPEPKQFWTVAGASHNDIVYAAGDGYRARQRHPGSEAVRHLWLLAQLASSGRQPGE